MIIDKKFIKKIKFLFGDIGCRAEVIKHMNRVEEQLMEANRVAAFYAGFQNECARGINVVLRNANMAHNYCTRYGIPPKEVKYERDE